MRRVEVSGCCCWQIFTVIGWERVLCNAVSAAAAAADVSAPDRISRAGASVGGGGGGGGD